MMNYILSILMIVFVCSCSTAPKKSPCPDDLFTSDKYDKESKMLCIRKQIKEDPYFKNCYDDMSKDERKNFNAEAHAEFFIDQDGKVSNFKIDFPIDPTGKFDSCLKDAFTKMIFPKPPKGKSVGVMQPLLFKN